MGKLLTPQDPPPYEIVEGHSAVPLLLICDHASNAVPQRLGRLGLDEAALGQHIAYDPGAALVTRRIAARLGVTAVLSSYSRLVVDCNRGPEDVSQIPEQSDGVQIAGNIGLSEEGRKARLDDLFWPYQNAVGAVLARLDAKFGRPVAVWSVHSFTPALASAPAPRPWHVGVVWKEDHAAAKDLIGYLSRDPALVIGDNQPYSRQTGVAYTLQRHAEGVRSNLLLEIKNSEISTAEGAAKYAALLAGYWQNEAYRSESVASA